MASPLSNPGLLGQSTLNPSQAKAFSTDPLFWLQVLLASFLIPKEIVFFIGSFLITPYRMLMILLAPYILWKLITSKRFQWLWCDSLALFVFLWPLLAYTLTSGIAVAAEAGGVLVLETSVPYFLTRLAITNYQSLKQLSKTLLACIAVLAIVSLPEVFTGRFYFREISYALTGNTYEYSVSQRLGLWRAMGPTTHPIILGTICASGIVISTVMANRQKRYFFALLLCAVGVFISLSSGPLLATLFQIFMLGWTRVFRGYRFKWWLLLALFLGLYLVIDVLSNRDPFRVMFSYMLFNPATGYARYYMWQYSLYLAGQDMMSMLFGYGNSTEFFDLIESPYWAFQMRQSVDSFWLVRLLSFGWPVLIAHTFFLIALFKKMGSQYRKSKIQKEKKLVQAWTFAASAMTLIAFTVDFWWQMGSFYYILLAAPLGASMGQRKKSRSQIAQTLKPSSPSLPGSAAP